MALHCKAEPGTNAGLAQAYPDRFHIPAYVGKQGWLGLWVDLPGIDWDEVSLVLLRRVPPGRTGAAQGAGRRRLVSLGAGQRRISSFFSSHDSIVRLLGSVRAPASAPG